jgi:DNA repair exonuclease SbcCD nuclease subunit
VIKFGFFTDPHVRADTPEGRTDDFRVAILQKLEECTDIWQRNSVDYVLCGGDWFHTPDPPNSIKCDVIDILKRWNKPVIGTIGSHDYYGYQIRSLKRTAVGVLYKADVVQLVGTGGSKDILPPYVDLESSLGKVRIVGTNHTYWLDKSPANYYALKDSSISYQIQLVHGNLLPFESMPFPFTKIEDVNTASDLVLIGHYHPGWQNIIKQLDTLYINPGSLGRVENTGAHRIPRVCIITLDNSGSEIVSKVEFVELTRCEKHPFKSKQEKEVEQVQDLEKLMNLFISTDVKAVDIKEQLNRLADEFKYSREVVETAFSYIEKQRS